MHMWRFEVVAEWCSVGFQFSASQSHMLLVGLVCLHLASTVALLEEAFHLWLLLAFVVVMIHGISDSVLCTSGVKHASAVAHWWMALCLLNIVTPSLCSWAQELMFSGLGAVQPLLNLFTFWKLGSELQRYFHFKKPSVKTSVFSKQALAFCLANK